MWAFKPVGALGLHAEGPPVGLNTNGVVALDCPTTRVEVDLEAHCNK